MTFNKVLHENLTKLEESTVGALLKNIDQKSGNIKSINDIPAGPILNDKKLPATSADVIETAKKMKIINYKYIKLVQNYVKQRNKANRPKLDTKKNTSLYTDTARQRFLKK